MTYKEYNKKVADARRSVSRKYGFRQSSYINFKVEEGYFFCLYFSSMKPGLLSSLCMPIPFGGRYGMRRNVSTRPLVCGARGTYALSGMVLAIYENLIDPKESIEPEIKDLYEHIFIQADAEISRFISNNPDADTFYPDETKMDYDPDRLLYLMALIHNKQEDKALLIIKEARSNKHHCVFCSGWNSDSYTYIKRWCNRGRTAERIRHRIDNIFNAIIRLRAFVIMSMSRTSRYDLPDFWDYRPLDGGIYIAIIFSWIFFMKNFTMAWISLAILVIMQFMVDGKRAKRYYREFMNLPMTIRQKWTLGAWGMTVTLWIYVILLLFILPNYGSSKLWKL